MIKMKEWQLILTAVLLAGVGGWAVDKGNLIYGIFAIVWSNNLVMFWIKRFNQV